MTLTTLVDGRCTPPWVRWPVRDPAMTCFAFRSRSPRVDILAVADAMEEFGWRMEVRQRPCVARWSTVHIPTMAGRSVPTSRRGSLRSMQRQQLPPTVHCSIMPHHINACDQFLGDLRTATDRVAADARVRTAPPRSFACFGRLWAGCRDRSTRRRRFVRRGPSPPRAPSWPIPASSSGTQRPARWTDPPRPRSRRLCAR